LSAGIRRTGSGSKFGLFKRASQDGGEHGPDHEVGGPAEPYNGRHTGGPTAGRKRSRKIVPAVAVAGALVAGAAAYSLAGSGSPQAAQLSDAAQPASLNSASHMGIGSVGGAEAAASATIKIAKTAGSGVARASARPRASTPAKTAAPKSAATPATRRASATHTATASAPTTATAAATPTATASAPSTHTASTLSCDVSSAMLPDNVTAIVSFLLANGYSDNAAAGIAGNMYQESKGDPESEGMGGGGLIGFTPLPAGYVTGNATADLQTQLSAVLTYNQQWASYLPELNAAATPADAADIYVTDFERAGIPAASTREASAEAVAEACDI
jgi:hypothetical protein